MGTNTVLLRSGDSVGGRSKHVTDEILLEKQTNQITFLCALLFLFIFIIGEIK